jgi:hypothetical protein
MDRYELDQAVNRQMDAAYWPWWFAVAYVQSKPARYDALRGGVETHLAFKGSGVDAVGAFGRVVAVLCGDDDPDSETFRSWQVRAEDRLMLAIRPGKVRAWGRPSPRETPVEIEPSAWIGGEVDCSDTCDLVREGWRNLCGVDRALNGERVVWFSDIHLPREQVMAWADHLEMEETRGQVDDALAGDYEAFAAMEAGARELEKGFWSAFVACAWVGSRCEQFTAAVQAYERAKLVERGGPNSASAWLVLGNVMGERFAVTATQAARQIEAAIADNRLSHGMGFDVETGRYREIQKPEWLGMASSHDEHGFSIVPGVYRVSWPSVDVRSAFPASDQIAQPMPPTPSLSPPSDADRLSQQQVWADGAVKRGVTITEARRDAVQCLGDELAPLQDLARELLRVAYQKAGNPVKRGRRKGSRSFAKPPNKI